MTQAELYQALKATGLPVVYSHWKAGDPLNQPPAPPYLIFQFAESDDLMADNHNYHAISAYDIELYSNRKDLAAEAKLENKLKELRIPYEKSETRIESEELFMVLYEITI